MMEIDRHTSHKALIAPLRAAMYDFEENAVRAALRSICSEDAVFHHCHPFGDDAGGGVTWAPQVIQDAADHGLVLAETGKLYDSKKGVVLPDGVKPMPMMSDAQLALIPEVPVEDVILGHVARYQDLMALAAKKPAKVIRQARAFGRQAWL